MLQRNVVYAPIFYTKAVANVAPLAKSMISLRFAVPQNVHKTVFLTLTTA
jgi:hypothetical protein